jgi:hypothetical protein
MRLQADRTRGGEAVSRRTRWSFLFGAALVLAACGGSNTATTAPEPTAAATVDSGGGGGGGTATTAPEPTVEATTDSGGGGGGTLAGKACDLLTVGEVESATQQTGITALEEASSDTGGSAACAYLLQGAAPIVVLTILDPANTSVDLSAYASVPGAVTVDVGSGAQAVYLPTMGGMFVVKNGLATNIMVVMTPEEGLQAATKLAKAVAGRLP